MKNCKKKIHSDRLDAYSDTWNIERGRWQHLEALWHKFQIIDTSPH